MVDLIAIEGRKISEHLVTTGLQYLDSSGVHQDPPLVLYHGFVEDLLQETISRSGEDWGPVTDDMTDRALYYLGRHVTPDDTSALALEEFVFGLLNFALLGVDVYPDIDEAAFAGAVTH